MSEATIREIEIAQGEKITLETGRLAKQADGAVVVRQGETMVLCTAVISRSVREGQGFFPLTVDYREKFSAGGKIPGGFIKREGRPTDKEILSSRLVDRAVRPLFPDGFLNEVQLICYVLSADEKYDADVLAGVGASAALLMAGAPFDGPIAEVRVGRVGDEFVVNPTLEQLEESDFDLVIAGKKDAIVMVEGEMHEVSEEDMIDALEIGHNAIKKLCEGQLQLVEDFGGVEPFTDYTTVGVEDELSARIHQSIGQRMADHIREPYEKSSFYGGIDDIKHSVVEEMLATGDTDVEGVLAEATEEGWTASDIRAAVSKVESDVMRKMIVEEGRRLDGRSLTDVRDIWCEVGYLPRVHGSAVFTRGETQVLASVTLGTGKDVQPVDQIFDTQDRRFFLHYNFPPFCTGEAKFLRGASRREIGHGDLAERALLPVLPAEQDFPYTIRINADVLESNGSSSMASVCSGCLALMDAGVPVKKMVAGVAMGLIKEGDNAAILTDILGTEDHLGDMDFKLTGTRDGITACQMDIKIAGLPRELMRKALLQARDARMHILDVMEQTLESPRTEMSMYAPRLTQITIDSDFIGAVIGPGGKVIQGIQRETGTTIEIEEKEGMGWITVAATNGEAAQKAIEMIRGIVTVPEAGEVYEGTVRNIQSFGAIVEILPGKEGLLHISELDHGYVDKVEDYVQVGDKVKVQLIEVRQDGKLRLSRKPFLPQPENGSEKPAGERRDGGDRGGDRNRGGRDRNRGGGRGGRDRRRD